MSRDDTDDHAASPAPLDYERLQRTSRNGRPTLLAGDVRFRAFWPEFRGRSVAWVLALVFIALVSLLGLPRRGRTPVPPFPERVDFAIRLVAFGAPAILIATAAYVIVGMWIGQLLAKRLWWTMVILLAIPYGILRVKYSPL